MRPADMVVGIAALVALFVLVCASWWPALKPIVAGVFSPIASSLAIICAAAARSSPYGWRR